MVSELMRRRFGGSEEKIERPDYFRFDFTTSEDNFVLRIGSYAAGYIEACLLDEVSVTPTSGDPTTITVPTAGNHTLYYHLYRAMPTNYNLIFRSSASYVRFPYNMCDFYSSAQLNCGAWTNKWDTIDILDSRFVQAVKTNGYNTYARANIIRVPTGAKQVYINNGTAAAITAIMVETDFNY